MYFTIASLGLNEEPRVDLSEGEGPTTSRVNLVVGDVQRTGLPDSFADAVIATLVLCSVESQEATLAEIRRLLKPGGKYYFVEHVAAGAGTPLRLAQDVLNPIQVRLRPALFTFLLDERVLTPSSLFFFSISVCYVN